MNKRIETLEVANNIKAGGMMLDYREAAKAQIDEIFGKSEIDPAMNRNEWIRGIRPNADVSRKLVRRFDRKRRGA